VNLPFGAASRHLRPGGGSYPNRRADSMKRRLACGFYWDGEEFSFRAEEIYQACPRSLLETDEEYAEAIRERTDDEFWAAIAALGVPSASIAKARFKLEVEGPECDQSGLFAEIRAAAGFPE